MVLDSKKTKGRPVKTDCLLSFLKSGAGEHRTPVRTKHHRAFYMLSRQFIFSSYREVGRHTRTVALVLNFAIKTDTLTASLSTLIRGAVESSSQRNSEEPSTTRKGVLTPRIKQPWHTDSCQLEC